MDKDWTLRLSLEGPMGENFHMCLDIRPFIVHDKLVNIKPPGPAEFGGTMVDTIRQIERRIFRKDILSKEAQRLGYLLAERMEDKEGWHGASREENLKDWGK